MQKDNKKESSRKWSFSNFVGQRITTNQQRLLKGGTDFITEDDVNNFITEDDVNN